MKLPDVNILVYAYDLSSPFNQRARSWLETALNGHEELGLAPVAALGFIRILSNPRICARPVAATALADVVESWLALPSCRLLAPGTRHFGIFRELFQASGAGSALCTDVHLAALAIEHRATLVSNDADFSRFPGLSLENPLGR